MKMLHLKLSKQTGFYEINKNAVTNHLIHSVIHVFYSSNSHSCLGLASHMSSDTQFLFLHDLSI